MDTTAPPACVRTIGAELATWERRLRTLPDSPEAGADPDSLAEVVTILSNAAHVFVYLEGNRKYLDYRSLEDERQRWIARLGGPGDVDPELERRAAELYATAERVAGLLENDRIALLARLGVTAGPTGPDAMFFRLNGSATSATARTKLAKAWRMPRERRLGEIGDLFDQLVEVRRAQARRRGFDTPLRETLGRCAISEADIEAFLDGYLRQALTGHQRLCAQIQAATGCTDNPMHHFAYFLRGLTAGENLPTVALQGCLDVIAAVAEKVLGVTVLPDDGSSPTALTMPVRVGGRLAGMIRIDLLGPDGGSGRAPLRDALPWDGAVLPVGRALCRYQPGPDGERLLTFDSAHSVFHEVGHALTQVLLRSRRPGPSGLEYLPVERLEDLSLWFEKWVYHPDFTALVAPTAELARGLDVCRRVKMLEFLGTHLQRGVVAALDFDVHRRTAGGFRESFQRLDDELGIGRHCDLGELLWTFTWPMYRANPGLGVVYLWGGAFGVEQFLPFLDTSLSALPAPDAFAGTFRGCFDPDVVSARPDIEAVPRFYENALSTARVR